MTKRMTHDEIEQLLGAYALDAVEDDERAAIEEHLEECPRCRAEVGEHVETAGLLAAGGGDAPRELWDRIAERIEGPGERGVDLPALRVTSRPDPVAPWLRPAVALTAIAAMVAWAVIAVAVVQQRRTLDDVRDQVAARGIEAVALRALTMPGAQRAVLQGAEGATLAQAVVLPDGTGFLIDDRLPPLEEGKTYQLWALVDGRAISAGVLGSDPDVVPFGFAPNATGLALTVEDEPGVEAPSQQPIAAGLLSA